MRSNWASPAGVLSEKLRTPSYKLVYKPINDSYILDMIYDITIINRSYKPLYIYNMYVYIYIYIYDDNSNKP